MGEEKKQRKNFKAVNKYSTKPRLLLVHVFECYFLVSNDSGSTYEYDLTNDTVKHFKFTKLNMVIFIPK